MFQIKESDWKIFRGVHEAALERYCDRVLSEINYMATDRETGSHERYLKVYRLLHDRDETLGDLFNNKSRSKALFMLAGIRGHGLVTDEEFAAFSQELREAVALVLSR
jgi:hypothetical protein